MSVCHIGLFSNHILVLTSMSDLSYSLHKCSQYELQYISSKLMFHFEHQKVRFLVAECSTLAVNFSVFGLTLDTSNQCFARCLQSMFKIEAIVWVSIWRALKFQLFSWRVGSNPRRQYENIEMKYKTHIKLVHELYGTCFQYNVKLRINYVSLLVVTMPYACWFLWRTDYIENFKWHLHFQFGVAFWRVVLSEVYFEGPKRVWRALKTSILNTDWSPSMTIAEHLSSSQAALICVLITKLQLQI